MTEFNYFDNLINGKEYGLYVGEERYYDNNFHIEETFETQFYKDIKNYNLKSIFLNLIENKAYYFIEGYIYNKVEITYFIDKNYTGYMKDFIYYLFDFFKNIIDYYNYFNFLNLIGKLFSGNLDTAKFIKILDKLAVYKNMKLNLEDTDYELYQFIYANYGELIRLIGAFNKIPSNDLFEDILSILSEIDDLENKINNVTIELSKIYDFLSTNLFMYFRKDKLLGELLVNLEDNMSLSDFDTYIEDIKSNLNSNMSTLFTPNLFDDVLIDLLKKCISNYNSKMNIKSSYEVIFNNLKEKNIVSIPYTNNAVIIIDALENLKKLIFITEKIQKNNIYIALILIFLNKLNHNENVSESILYSLINQKPFLMDYLNNLSENDLSLLRGYLDLLSNLSLSEEDINSFLDDLDNLDTSVNILINSLNEFNLETIIVTLDNLQTQNTLLSEEQNSIFTSNLFINNGIDFLNDLNNISSINNILVNISLTITNTFIINLSNLLNDILNGLYADILSGLKIDKITDLINRLLNRLRGLLCKLEFMLCKLVALFSLLGSFLNFALSFNLSLNNILTNVNLGLKNLLTNTAASLINSVNDIKNNLLQNIDDNFNDILDDVFNNIIDDIINNLYSLLITKLDPLIVLAFLDFMKKKFLTCDTLKNEANNQIDSLKNTINDLATNVINGINTDINNILKNCGMSFNLPEFTANVDLKLNLNFGLNIDFKLPKINLKVDYAFC